MSFKGGGGEGGGHEIYDETTALPQKPKLAFIGTPVTVTNDGDTTNVTFSPSGGADTKVKMTENGTPVSTIERQIDLDSAFFDGIEDITNDWNRITLKDLPQSKITNLVTDLSNKSAVGHTHVKTDITDFAHTHPQSEIVNLVTDLSNKAPISHNHVKADITDFAHTHPQSDITNLVANLASKLENITGENIEDLANVVLTAIGANEILQYDGANFINRTLAEAGISPVSHTHLEADITDLQNYLLNITAEDIGDLGDITNTVTTNRAALMHNGAGQLVSRLLVEADISNLQSYLTSIADNSITTSKILDANVTLAKLENISQNTVIGRILAGSGVPAALTATELTAMLNLFSSTLKGLVPLSGGGTTKFLRADGTWVVPSGVGSGKWEELGRDTLTVAGGSLSVSSLPARKYIMILIYVFSVGGTINMGIRFNNDSGNNYARRYSNNGGADSTTTSTNSISVLSATATYHNASLQGIILNAPTKEKLMTVHSTENQSTGAGNAPSRRELLGKWANTSVSINRIDAVDLSGTGDFAIGSEMIVLGFE